MYIINILEGYQNSQGSKTAIANLRSARNLRNILFV